MNHEEIFRKKCFGIGRVLYRLVICGILVFFTTLDGNAEEDRWRFSLGGGGYVQNVYPGSDETFATVLPYATVAYAGGRYGAAVSLIDGISLTYDMPEKQLAASIKINSGDERDSEEYTAFIYSKDHSNKVKALLEGTPAVNTAVTGEFRLDYMTPAGIWGCALEYHPTTVKGDTDRHYNGFVLALSYAKAFPVTGKLALTGVAGVTIMDENYADAWFSLEASTHRLDAFDAGAGLKDAQLSMQLQYAASRQVSLMLLAKNAWFLADAEKSPFTQSAYQMTWALLGTYNF